MSDSAAPSTPPPATPSDTQPEATSPDSSAIPPIKPGYKTSEAWITLILMILGWLPSSGLLASSPIALQIVGLALSFLSGSHYVAQRSSLKRTTANASGDVERHYTYAHVAAALANGLTKPTKAALLVLVLGAGAMQATACSSAQNAAAKSTGISCIESDAIALLPDVAKDIGAPDPAAALGATAVTAGEDLLACAVRMWLAVRDANAASSATPSTAQPTKGEIAARALINGKTFR